MQMFDFQGEQKELIGLYNQTELQLVSLTEVNYKLQSFRRTDLLFCIVL